jgi:hypothetical protein
VKIAVAKNPDSRPRTRRELLAHLWARGIATGNVVLQACNVFKEGPFYAVHSGHIIAATHSRTIDSRTFSDWERFVINVPQGVSS